MAGEIASLAQPTFSSELRGCLDRVRRPSGSRCLVIGNLRSYGDEVLSVDGHYIQTTRCDRVLEIDTAGSTVTVECGVSVASIQALVAPLGYMLPVTPGTAFLTVGGAIANDVHGKNHHVAGTFGLYVAQFELVRSNGDALICSPTENTQWFAATIGGMGLTGVITWATLKLKQISSPFLRVRSHRFANLGEFFAIDANNSSDSEYAVAWIDCLASGKSLGRGIYSAADHERDAHACVWPRSTHSRASRNVPFTLPVSPINRLSLGLFNQLYFRMHRNGERRVHFRDWLYPLDSIGSWNRLYGKRGFYQFQCVVPKIDAVAAVQDMLRTISRFGQGSFLAVLKNFGDKTSPGLMSFPLPGTTLALDFPNMGTKTERILSSLHAIAAAAGGRLYAAKDGFSPSRAMEQGYPNFSIFQRYIDPAIGSVLARRMQLID